MEKKDKQFFKKQEYVRPQFAFEIAKI